MAFFEKIGGAITSGVGATANKAKEVTDQTKLGSEINTKKKELKEIYAQIGKLYVENAEADKLCELKTNATELSKYIESLEEKYNDAKGLKKCEICGEIIDNASVFCAHCGGKQTVRVNKCVKCRAVLADGVAFCYNCGTKQPDLNAVITVEEPKAEKVVEATPVVAPVIETEPEAEPVVEPVIEEEPEIETVIEAEPVIESAENIVPDFVPAEEIEVKEVEKPKPEFIFCTNCGNKESAGTNFCSECGTKL